MDIPDEPAPSLHPHPSEQRLHSYYEPVRQRAPRPVLNASGFCLGTLPLATLEACDPGRRFDARLLTFHARAADQAHAASTPGTTWPRTRAPARLISRDEAGPPISMPSKPFRRLNSDAPPGHPGRALLERLPGPHLTRSSRAFSLIAHHDGLQPTQHQGGLTPAPAGPTPEGQQASISRTAPLFKDVFLHSPPSAFVTHASQLLRDGPPLHPASLLSPSRIQPLGVLAPDNQPQATTAPLAGRPIGAQVHTFRTRARTTLAPPPRRTPPGQSTGIRQTDPRAGKIPWF